jgi:hypothetical protein
MLAHGTRYPSTLWDSEQEKFAEGQRKARNNRCAGINEGDYAKAKSPGDDGSTIDWAVRSEWSCGTVLAVDISSVALVAGNSFQAETVTTMTFGEEGSATMKKRGTVSRDWQGRVRSERVTGIYKMATGDDVGKEVELKVVTICDPVTRTLTQLDPLGKTAKVWLPSANDKEGAFDYSQNYCEMFSEFKNASQESFKDLGRRTIEGFETEGIRQILKERRTDARGNDMPEKMDEHWCALDLQAVVLRVFQGDFRNVVELKNIQRTEPDPALFEIPRDYTVVEKTAMSVPPTGASETAGGKPGVPTPKKNP